MGLPRPRAELLAVVGSNLIAPLGVLALGWSPTVLLGVFVLELVAVIAWATVRIPFAAKRPNDALDEDDRLLGPLQEKRGGVGIPGPLPPVYLRNAPTLLVAVVLLAPIEIAVAVAAFALAEPNVTTESAGQILLGGFGVFLGRGVETWADYFRDGGYRDHSPRSVLLTPFEHLFGVGALLLLVGPTGVAASSGGLLAVVLAGKLAYDLRTVQIRRDDDRRGIFYRLYGGAETEIEPVPVDTPDGEPIVRTRPPRRVAVADALYRGVRYTVTSAVVACYLAAAAVAAFGSFAFALAPLAVAGAFAALRATTRYLRHGTLEYRCYDGVVVAYDRLLSEPQARLERSAVTGAAVETDLVDRAFGTRTLDLDADGPDSPELRLTVPDPEQIEGDDANADRPLSLCHVDDPRAVAAALGVTWRLERSATVDAPA